jgi:hypothetical protein
MHKNLHFILNVKPFKPTHKLRQEPVKEGPSQRSVTVILRLNMAQHNVLNPCNYSVTYWPALILTP